jgi:hypothetical protein
MPPATECQNGTFPVIWLAKYAFPPVNSGSLYSSHGIDTGAHYQCRKQRCVFCTLAATDTQALLGPALI